MDRIDWFAKNGKNWQFTNTDYRHPLLPYDVKRPMTFLEAGHGCATSPPCDILEIHVMNVGGGRTDPLVLLLCSEKPVVWIRIQEQYEIFT